MQFVVVVPSDWLHEGGEGDGRGEGCYGDVITEGGCAVVVGGVLGGMRMLVGTDGGMVG